MAYDGQWPYPMYQLLDHFVTYDNNDITQPTFSFMSVMKPIALFPSKKVTFDTRKYNDLKTRPINKDKYKNSTVWADLSDHYPIIGRFSFAPARVVAAQGAPEEEKVSATKKEDVILNKLNTHILSDTARAVAARAVAAPVLAAPVLAAPARSTRLLVAVRDARADRDARAAARAAAVQAAVVPVNDTGAAKRQRNQ
jgi:hypothetical protein